MYTRSMLFSYFVLIIFRLWFNIGAGLISINICIAAFLIVWLTYIKKITTDEWERRFPAAIPVATGCFVIGAIW